MLTVPNEMCSNTFPANFITANHQSLICAVREDNIRTTMMSGGPLIAKDKLIGFLSFGFVSSHEKPSIFTRISPYLSWLESVTGIRAL